MANPYAAFLNLLPKQVKSIGKIYTIDTDGTAVVDGVNGQRYVVKGAGSGYGAEDYVLVVDGLIVSKVSDVQAVISHPVI